MAPLYSARIQMPLGSFGERLCVDYVMLVSAGGSALFSGFVRLDFESLYVAPLMPVSVSSSLDGEPHTPTFSRNVMNGQSGTNDEVA